MKTHERELPSGYVLKKRIDAVDKKTGLLLNVIAILVSVAVVFLLLIPNFAGGIKIDFTSDSIRLLITALVFVVVDVAYIVLHELVHGFFYKVLTKEKLTFGITLSCAYCGVPNVYTYRKTALVAVSAPLIVFSIIFASLCIILYNCAHPLTYFACAVLFGFHIGGCIGDAYMISLLLFRFKENSLLVKDTGPIQEFYVKE